MKGVELLDEGLEESQVPKKGHLVWAKQEAINIAAEAHRENTSYHNAWASHKLYSEFWIQSSDDFCHAPPPPVK